jgi:hypothetical protein
MKKKCGEGGVVGPLLAARVVPLPVFRYGIWALGYSLHVYFAHHLMHCRLRSIVFLGHNV